MMHQHRSHMVFDVASVEDLAEKLTQRTWCGCSGFRLPVESWDSPLGPIVALLFLSDATSGDGAQEYAVILEPQNYGLTEGRILDLKDPGAHQVESVTFSWMTEAAALETLRQYAKGERLCEPWPTPIHIQRPEVHGRCGLCA